jgi:hypothetical protein
LQDLLELAPRDLPVIGERAGDCLDLAIQLPIGHLGMVRGVACAAEHAR